LILINDFSNNFDLIQNKFVDNIPTPCWSDGD